jgi:hypothetical protein
MKKGTISYAGSDVTSLAALALAKGKSLPNCGCGIGNDIWAFQHFADCVRAAMQLLQAELDEWDGE